MWLCSFSFDKIACKAAVCLPTPVDSMRDAVFTVSPNRQYRGMRIPITPATQEPGKAASTPHHGIVRTELMQSHTQYKVPKKE